MCVIDAEAQIKSLHKIPLSAPLRQNNHSEQDPQLWWKALTNGFNKLAHTIDINSIVSICINGTSGTLVAVDAAKNPLSAALMYNDARAIKQAQTLQLKQAAAASPNASLSKALWLQQHLKPTEIAYFLHQSDWLSWRLSDAIKPFSDSNNALKMGYEPRRQNWLKGLPDSLLAQLPNVLPPGSEIGRIDSKWVQQWGFNPNCKVRIGTTDSIAAVIATGAHQRATAVTSLGSTLVLKLLSDQPVEDAASGIYSHQLGDWWLCGGASNSGGRVLAEFFSPEALQELSKRIDPESDSDLDYYPLCGTGERFPIADPSLAARLSPRPKDDVAFLHGLLQSMARIERMGYEKLVALGAPAPTEILSAGGGASNPAWQRIRERELGIAVKSAQQAEACYGSALLALHGLQPFLAKKTEST